MAVCCIVLCTYFVYPVDHVHLLACTKCTPWTLVTLVESSRLVASSTAHLSHSPAHYLGYGGRAVNHIESHRFDTH